MRAMWAPLGPGSSRRAPMAERRRAGDDPANHANGDSKANQGDPPFSGPHRLGAGVERSSAGDHRLCQMLSAKSVEDDGCNVEDDQAEDDVEPALVQVARAVGSVDADQAGQRAGEDAVLVL